MFETLRSRVKEIYQQYERWIPIAGFVLGFLFDATLLRRIDEPKVIVQQAIYLLLSCCLITVDLFEFVREIHPPLILNKIWKYREFLLHFMLGTLLNSYTIFYFKSASGLTSYIFIFILIASLTLSEFKRFGNSQHQVHMGLWSLCLISYLQALVPILFGAMGILPFLASCSSSIFIFWCYYRLIKPKLVSKPELLKTHVVYPFAAIQGIFALLYFANAIPPVPLSVSYMGIYHQAEKKDGQYLLSYQHSWFKFWQHGDETFEARPGDTVIAFIQVFSPSGFKDQLQIRWLLHDPKSGWQAQDAIPLTVSGGRDEGYRALIQKNNYQPGKWRVQVETKDNREVGRIGFTIVPDLDTGDRSFNTEVR